MVKTKVKLVIVGPNEDEEYWKLCRDAIDQLPENITVKYAGQIIPDKMNNYYKECHVYVSPTLNENYGHSIVEAIGYGCPVIISDKTPWRDLEKKGIGFDLDLEEGLFAEKIEFYADMTQEEFNQYRFNARNFARTELVNEKLIQKSIDLFKN